VAKRAAPHSQYSGQYSGQGSSLILVVFARPEYVGVCIAVKGLSVLASVDFSFIFEV
jgi:hypothetical protein